MLGSLELRSQGGPSPTISPVASANQQDAIGPVSRSSDAHRILEAHKKGLDSRRERDLISEKLMLHVDGSGDFQWADIFEGVRIEIPRLISEYRKQENLLRLIVANAIAHHTTIPLHFFAESSTDREARDRALIDSMWINHLAHEQDFNGLFAEALTLAMSTGFCPVHRYWREDADNDWFEPVAPGPQQGGDASGQQPSGVKQGMIDCWVGNPFSTVFDRNARVGSVHWCSYERILSADQVRKTFAHVEGVEGLVGTTKLPSSAIWQVIARNWYSMGLGLHGSPVLEQRRQKGDEMLSVIVMETAPGELVDYPQGRLQIIAVPGEIETRRGRSETGHALLLADQVLPGGDYSWTNFYSHSRPGDIHGKPWIEDIDALQVDLNIALSKRWEHINKMAEAPIVSPGGAISEDMADIDGYNILEVEPSAGGWRPQVMEWPNSIMEGLNKEIEEKRRAIFTGGGYQASSRGEAAGSRIAAQAIMALQQADNTVHGPVNQLFKRSACDFSKGCHTQFRAFGDVPWLVSVVGDEHAYLVKSYIDNTKVSKVSPRYKLVNSFGSSPELRAQEILALVKTQGADGLPFLTTQEARRLYPDQLLFNQPGDAQAVQIRRAKTISKAIRDMAADFRKETGFQETDKRHPWVMQAAQQVFYRIEVQYERMRDDLLLAHIESLSELTQDEEADPIARMVAVWRQALYFEWQAMMAQGMGAPPGTPLELGPGDEAPAPDGDGPGRPGGRSRQEVGADMQRSGTGETLSEQDDEADRAAAAR